MMVTLLIVIAPRMQLEFERSNRNLGKDGGLS